MDVSPDTSSEVSEDPLKSDESIESEPESGSLTEFSAEIPIESSQEPTVDTSESVVEPSNQQESEDNFEESSKDLSVYTPSADLKPDDENKGNETESTDSNSQDIQNQTDAESKEEEISIDFEHLDKKTLLAELKKLGEILPVTRISKALKEIKPVFDQQVNDERNAAFERYTADGGEKEGFEYHGDPIDEEFDKLHKELRDRLHQYFHDSEKAKENNLAKKNDVLERLRELVDGEETTASIESLKTLQNEWKEVGPVHPQHNKTLWANYNALITRFYDNRSIYFELKELDRRKNLGTKIDICERAEGLDKLENVNEAISQLNELHEEFRHVGPIPRDDQESIWQRFKAASDTIYAKRKKLVEELKEQLRLNQEKKEMVILKLKPFTEFDSDRINEWNKKTKEILALQKEWEAIGGVPRESSKMINKSFWSEFKKFFNNKSEFFKRLEEMRQGNLELKKELVTKAEELKESLDWDSAAQQFKDLQKEWKTIGPVPEKFKDSVYQEFKAACDHFFNRKREQLRESEKEYYDNLDAKNKILNEMEAFCEFEDFGLDQIYDKQEEFSRIGFVPKNAIRSTQDRYGEVIDKLVTKVEQTYPELAEDFKFRVNVKKMRSGPNAAQKLNRKENDLRKKIQDLSNDINTWRTNMEFFADSKGARSLKEEMEGKIVSAENELKALKKQLKLVRGR